jgi:hypothetical protein
VIYFYIFYASVILSALVIVADYAVPCFTKRTLPGWLKPLILAASVGYFGWFFDTYTDNVVNALTYMQQFVIANSGMRT